MRKAFEIGGMVTAVVLVAFGIVGLFIGPVILAVTFTLMQAWIAQEVPPEPAEPGVTSDVK